MTRRTLPRVGALTFLVALVAAGVGAARGLGASAAAPSPPFDVPPAVAARAGIPHGEAGALLVVTPTCPWCRRELATWARLIDEGAGIVPVVLVAGGTAEAPREWIPVALAARTVPDPSGSLAAELDVSRVPTTIWFDADGSVHTVLTGASPAARLRELRTPPNPPEAP